MDQLLQLQSQFPEFWTKQLLEATGLQDLLLAYSYVYGDAIQKWQEVKNELSPFTTDPYSTEFYKIINLRKPITSSSPNPINLGGIDYTNSLYELPDNTFFIESVSKSIEFITYIDNCVIIYDQGLQKTLVGLDPAQFNLTDEFLYIKKIYRDNKNMINTYGSLFDIKPYINTDDPLYEYEDQYIQQYNIFNYQKMLLSTKAQIINMIRCATHGGTVDSLESLISVAMNNPYVTEDGIVVSYDNNNTWIDTNGIITKYPITPKLRFQIPNAPIYAYEAIGECPVNIYSYSINPARFTQALLCEQAQILFQLLTLNDNEEDNTLYFDQPNVNFDAVKGINFYDFGGMQKQNNAQDVYPNYQNPRKSQYDYFTDVTFTTLNPRIYELFKNVLIAETPNNDNWYNGPGSSFVDEVWLNSILEYFRPLHSKYVVVGFTSSGGEN